MSAARRRGGRLSRGLQNPAALVVEGFMAGAVLVLAAQPFDEPTPAPSAGGSVLSTLRV